MKNIYSILTGQSKWKISVGRHWRGFEDNIKINLREWNVRLWIGFMRLRKRFTDETA
jgi:hypothetical protein